MIEQKYDKGLIQMSDDFLEQVNNLRKKSNVEVKTNPNYLLNSNEKGCWSLGYRAGYKKAIEDLKIKI